jgi:transposase InsO family protein
MHKNTKLTPSLRRDIYEKWSRGSNSLRHLAEQYHVDKNIIKTVILRGKIGDFTVHDSVNHRYRTIEYGLKRLSYTERQVGKKLAKRERRANRYERKVPGEMIHGDTKRFPNIYRPDRFRQKIIKAPVLYIAIDDYSRFLTADILPDKTMWSSAIFFESSALRMPFSIDMYYTDNGGEYKGNETHALVSTCARLGIQQRYTKPNHPWTNGKAERVIQTITKEWFNKNKDQFTSLEIMRRSLYEYVDWYNHERKHQGLNNLTPAQRLSQYYHQSGDNA